MKAVGVMKAENNPYYFYNNNNFIAVKFKNITFIFKHIFIHIYYKLR